MEPSAAAAAVSAQREYFRTAATLDYGFRIRQLDTLKRLMRENENEILGALKSDLGKSPFEAFLTEIGVLHEEINFIRARLKSWMRPRRVRTPWLQAWGSSRIYPEPKGVVLILGPWNYPFQLVITPLVGALAAGNCAVLKPSEFAPETSRLLESLIPRYFDPRLVTVVNGGAEVAQALLKQRFDHIFFTGGAAVGKVVMKAAAEHLTPITLELGGKSPCLVDTRVDLDTAARRIVWGKFLNAGQTCVAPDYLLVHEGQEAALAEAMGRWVERFFGPDPRYSPDYARIVHRRHFDRLAGMLEGASVRWGGQADPEDLYLAPTLISPADPEAPVMREEIFGPLLPVVPYRRLTGAIEFINARPKPLALYFFSENRDNQNKVLRETSFGGGCINDTLMHLGNPRLPFGGVGESGIGAYRGRASFETFSHHKPVVHKSLKFDPSLRYPPYRDRLSLLRRWLR